jgi:hypothetical protein
VIATARDEMKVPTTLNPAQSFRHGDLFYARARGIECWNPTLCCEAQKPKASFSAKDGAPSSIVRDGREEKKGWTTRLVLRLPHVPLRFP